jgi:hypothetical protein
MAPRALWPEGSPAPLRARRPNAPPRPACAAANTAFLPFLLLSLLPLLLLLPVPAASQPTSVAAALSSAPTYSLPLLITGSQDSSSAALTNVGRPQGVSYTQSRLGAPAGAITLAAGSYMGTPERGQISNLPSGDFMGVTISAWVKCRAADQPAGSAGTIFEYGAPGEYSSMGSRKFSLLVQLPLQPTFATVAGGFAPPTDKVFSRDGTGQAAALNYVMGMVYVGQDLFVADMLNCQIRRITPAGVVTTFAGYPPKNPADGFQSGYVDGVGTNAKFWSPFALVASPSGNGLLYVTDFQSQCIRTVSTTNAQVGTLTGRCIGRVNLYTIQAFPSETVQVDGPRATARFVAPSGIAINPAGTELFVTDECTIRKIVIATGAVTTFAGGACGSPLADGIGTAATFSRPPVITGSIL